jgi:chemotaxis protein methyltransferase CheR
MRLLDYVKNDLGLSAYKDSYLLRRLNSRMVRVGTTSEEEYLKLLKTSRKELDALKDALSINVTSFFRNTEVWDKLKELLKCKSYVKIWSAACSEGREPYSLAIICEEIGTKADIIATDIDEDALNIAKKGEYSNVEEELSYLKSIDRYFTTQNGKVTVKPFLKTGIRFIKHNMISDPPPSRDFDFVLCRNFLIYVEQEHKPVIAQNIAKALKKDGILVLGKTETLPTEGFFEPLDRVNKIFRKV